MYPASSPFPSPDSEEAPPWPPAGASLNGTAGGDARSPSLSGDEQSSEASPAADSGGVAVHADTPQNLMLAVLDSVAGKRFVNCKGDKHVLIDSDDWGGPSFIARLETKPFPQKCRIKMHACKKKKSTASSKQPEI